MSCKLSGESQTSWVRLVKVGTAVASREAWFYDYWSGILSCQLFYLVDLTVPLLLATLVLCNKGCFSRQCGMDITKLVETIQKSLFLSGSSDNNA